MKLCYNDLNYKLNQKMKWIKIKESKKKMKFDGNH